MTDYLSSTGGWIRLSYGSDTLTLRCEDWTYDDTDKSATQIPIPNWNQAGYTLNTHGLVIKLKKVWVDSESDWNTMKAQLKAAAAASSCTIRIQTSSTPSYELIDGAGGADEIPIIIKDKKGINKPFRGDGSKFIIKQITLLVIGTAT